MEDTEEKFFSLVEREAHHEMELEKIRIEKFEKAHGITEEQANNLADYTIKGYRGMVTHHLFGVDKKTLFEEFMILENLIRNQEHNTEMKVRSLSKQVKFLWYSLAVSYGGIVTLLLLN